VKLESRPQHANISDHLWSKSQCVNLERSAALPALLGVSLELEFSEATLLADAASGAGLIDSLL